MKNIQILIDNLCDKIFTDNMLFNKAKHQGLSNEEVQRYLSMLYYMFKSTDHLCKVYAKASEKSNLPFLEQFYTQKITDELGHSNWAEKDMNSLNLTLLEEKNFFYPSKVQKYFADNADSEPYLYLAYAQMAEYFTVKYGGKLLEYLELNSGIKRTSISSVNNHVELDKEHIHDDMRVIGELLGISKSYEMKFENALIKSAEIINNLLSYPVMYESTDFNLAS